LIRHDLRLTYAQIGLLIAVPALAGSALDLLIGAYGDTPRRRALVVAGGIAFALSAVLTAGAVGFWTLLVSLLVAYPASGAFVSLAQATLVDGEPEKRERNMARWTLAGSFGYVGGPASLAASLWIGVGWRGAIALSAVATLSLALKARHLPQPPVHVRASPLANLRHALGSLRRRDVLRWLALLELVDLLGDVFHGFLALYLVDGAGAGPAEAALGVAVWTGAALVGDSLLLLVLRRISGLRHLRMTAALALVAYPAFLIVPGIEAKLALAAVLGLLNSGWYAIPKARLYATLPGRSGAVITVGGIGSVAGAVVPLVLGALAGAAGLATAMWLLLLAPVALLVLAPRPEPGAD
jgi:MFS transporter, FSR family, fosmidomycin resistance protein